MDQYIRKAQVLKVVDGDTLDLRVDLGFRIFTNIRGRLLGVDTPERGRTDFAYATEALRDLLEQNKDEDGNITIKSKKTGKYGRWLVEIEGVNTILAQKWPYG